MDISNFWVPLALKINDVVVDWDKVADGVVAFIVVVAASFLVLLALTSFLRFHSLIARIHNDEDIEPEDAFYIRVVRRIANIRLNPDPFCLVLVDVKALRNGEVELLPREGIERVVEMLRPLLRKGDDCWVYKENNIAMLIETGPENMTAVRRRLSEHLKGMDFSDDEGGRRKLAFNFGCAFFPDTADGVEDLFQSAQGSLEKSVSAGNPGEWRFATPLPEAGETEEEESEASAPSYIDPVTGLLISSRMSAAAQKFISQYRREDKDVSIMFIRVLNLDRYINDYGEDVLDPIRSEMSDILQANLREDDLIGCWDDHTFLVGTDGDARCSQSVAKRVIGNLKGARIKKDSYRLRIKASIGIAGYPDHKRLPRDILHAAELALEDACRKGTNIFECFDLKLEKREKERAEREKEVF